MKDSLSFQRLALKHGKPPNLVVGKKKKRTGKELWKIARKLIMKPKVNLAQMIIQSAKE